MPTPTSDPRAEKIVPASSLTHPPARRVRVGAYLLVIVFGAVLAIGMLELGIRLFVPVTDVAYQFGDPLIGSRRIPNQDGVNRMGQTMNAHYHFNAQGWNHPRDYVIKKPNGTRRVCIVGDSCVEAIQVDVDKTLYCEAETLMNRPQRPVEWLAFGNSGWGTTQEYEVIRHYVLDYSPDIVVLFFVQNDPWDSSPYLLPLTPSIVTYRLDQAGELELMPPTIYQPGRLRRLLSYSALVRYFVLQKRLLERLYGGGPTAATPPIREDAVSGAPLRDPAAATMTFDERKKKTWELIEKTLAAMRDECKNRGATLMIAFRGCEPVIEAAKTGKPASRPARSEDPYCLGSRVQDMGPEWVEPIANRLKIPYLDLTAALSEAVAKSGKTHVFPDDSHYNEMAHQAAAHALADWIDAYWKANPSAQH